MCFRGQLNQSSLLLSLNYNFHATGGYVYKHMLAIGHDSDSYATLMAHMYLCIQRWGGIVAMNKPIKKVVISTCGAPPLVLDSSTVKCEKVQKVQEKLSP